MAKRNPKSGSAKKSNSGRTGKPLNVWIDQQIFDALMRYLGETQLPPTKTAVVEHSLKEFLAGKGYWPPKE